MVFDQRGHGASTRVPQDVSRSAFVVGQSLGGQTAFLDQGILEELDRTFAKTDVIEEAFAEAAQARRGNRASAKRELTALTTEIRKTEQAIDRYLAAFEAGTMPEHECGERVHKLTAKLATLKYRREDLEVASSASVGEFDARVLRALRRRIASAMRSKNNEAKKGLLRELVHDIQVNGGREALPTFRVPVNTDSVRIDRDLAAPTGFEPVSPP